MAIGSVHALLECAHESDDRQLPGIIGQVLKTIFGDDNRIANPGAELPGNGNAAVNCKGHARFKFGFIAALELGLLDGGVAYAASGAIGNSKASRTVNFLSGGVNIVGARVAVS